jgi:hypothetical protein
MSTNENSMFSTFPYMLGRVKLEYHRQVDRIVPRVSVSYQGLEGLVEGYLSKDGNWVTVAAAENAQVLYDNDEEAAAAFRSWQNRKINEELDLCPKPPSCPAAAASAA